jgi:hypothetical protein
MGDVAEMMLDGILCEICGVLMDDFCGDGVITEDSIPGYPRQCEDCREE